jgi:signal transduction histidine kinase
MFHLIDVSDNGIGFEPHHAERIFQVFQRLHGRSDYQGTGIGLAIVQKVVENHKGYITAHGQPGSGATFHILLPEIKYDL